MGNTVLQLAVFLIGRGQTQRPYLSQVAMANVTNESGLSIRFKENCVVLMQVFIGFRVTSVKLKYMYTKQGCGTGPV
jgi:hypothetical protein